MPWCALREPHPHSESRRRARAPQELAHYRAAWAAGIEFAAYDELVCEIEAQLAAFRAICGRDPDYFEAHAVQSRNLTAAIHDVAVRHGFKEQPLPENFDFSKPVQVGGTLCRMAGPDMVSPDHYDPELSLTAIVEAMAPDETTIAIFHPDYLDAFLLDHSSLTQNRTRSVDMLIDPAMRAWLERQSDLSLIDYRDL